MVDENRTQRLATVVRVVALAAIVGGLVLVVRALPVARALADLEGWVAQSGVLGMLGFAGAYVAAAILFLPGSALTLMAGAVFGLWIGLALVSVSSTLAAGAAFLVARYLARERVRRLAARTPTFAAIDRAISRGGWRIVALLRLSPAIPYNASNYLYGLTGVRFGPYLLASWICMLPGTFLYVYLGYAGREGLAGGRTPGEWALLGVGLAATAAVTVYVTKLARRALAERTELDEDPAAGASEDDADGPAFGRGTLVLGAGAIVAVAAGLWAQTHEARLRGLFGPPSVEPREVYAEREDGPRVDHALFDALLREHVDAQGLVDYRGLAERADELERYLDVLAEAPWEELGRDEKLAYLLDAYDAATLKLVLERYPLASIRDIPADERWKAERWDVAGELRSLDEIEHELVRTDFREPRVHFALVCAALGCPPLRTEAYSGERLEEQLADQAARVHADPRWFAYDEDAGVVRLTRLYDWFAGDFEAIAESPLAFAARYAPALAEALARGERPRVEWIEYDWSLNDQASAGRREESR